MSEMGLVVLPITVPYSDVQSRLPAHHGDPFDRLLVAQAQVDGVPLISSAPLLELVKKEYTSAKVGKAGRDRPRSQMSERDCG